MKHQETSNHCPKRSNGRENLVDDPRPGQANTVTTADLINKVDDLVRSDRRVTLRMLAVKVDVSVETEWTIVHDRLRYQKVYSHMKPEETIIPPIPTDFSGPPPIRPRRSKSASRATNSR
ncbi:Protein GVQW3 like protein [Argiope bruennichi]|uniref:Protein GVQW3 like protein n=1 Tax=Argiope bruennichi TaxID=94029 RepID=A0A8T0FL56_ARGBR|nr:Protein GVQW3 like protein [Argiope bruennichi]